MVHLDGGGEQGGDQVVGYVVGAPGAEGLGAADQLPAGGGATIGGGGPLNGGRLRKGLRLDQRQAALAGYAYVRRIRCKSEDFASFADGRHAVRTGV